MDKLNINVELRFVTLIFGTILTAFCAWFFTKDSPSLVNAVSILQVGFTFFALVYTAMSINAAAQVNDHALIVKKKEKAFDFLDRFHELDEKGVTRKSRAARDAIRGKTAEEIPGILDGMKEEKAALFTTLNYFETLAIAIHHKIADEEVAFSAFKSIVLGHRNTMLKFIEKHRLTNNSSTYFRNFTDLAEKWSNR